MKTAGIINKITRLKSKPASTSSHLLQVVCVGCNVASGPRFQFKKQSYGRPEGKTFTCTKQEDLIAGHCYPVPHS